MHKDFINVKLYRIAVCMSLISHVVWPQMVYAKAQTKGKGVVQENFRKKESEGVKMNSHKTQKEKMEAFHRLHHNTLLLLPNAWDAVSAKIFEQEGAQAIGTTSAGIAAALGYPDGGEASC
jgi:hypothetical protein